MIEIGIIGYGFVGKAVGQLAMKDKIRVIPFDPCIEEYAGPSQMLAAYDADFVFVCVPTPADVEDGRLDVSIVVDVANKWQELSTNNNSILIIKSTIPVGTTDELCEFLETDHIVHNPEFLSQRTAMEDFKNADEIIIGGANRGFCERVKEVYELWWKQVDRWITYKEQNIIITDAKLAEMTKIARNSFYAVKVTYMNEVAEVCKSMEIDYAVFRKIFARSGKHAWINPQHTYVPGPDGLAGYGGRCIIKDALGLAALADTYDVDMAVLKTTNKQNKLRRPDEYKS